MLDVCLVVAALLVVGAPVAVVLLAVALVGKLDPELGAVLREKIRELEVLRSGPWVVMFRADRDPERRARRGSGPGREPGAEGSSGSC